MNATPIELSVVIPVKNEEENVVPLLEELEGILHNLCSHEILVIDDGSTDGTWAALESLKPRMPVLRLIRFDRNYGQSAGFWAGFSRVRGRIVVSMDGDMQNDPHDIPKILDELKKGAEVCLTYRANRRDTWFKKVQSRIGNGTRNLLLKSDIRDTGSQLRGYYAYCLKDLPSFEGMHRFMGNLFAMRGYRIVQIPTNHRHRRAGKTKYGLRNRAWRGLKDLFAMRWLATRLIRYGVVKED